LREEQYTILIIPRDGPSRFDCHHRQLKSILKN